MALAAGCGGGGGGPDAQRLVRGRGFTFSAPEEWTVVRSQRQVQVAAGKKSAELVAVSRFPLLRRFRPELLPKVRKELDRAAGGIAEQQHGTVRSSDDVTISGRNARRYDIDYELRGKKLVETIAFVLRGKTEYLLLCRHERAEPSDACETLLSSFRLSS